MKEKDKPTGSRQDKGITPQERDRLWQESIAKAKSMVKVKSNNQMMIAEIALSVCEISWGGAQMKGKYTLKRFADETGIGVKSISHWCSVYRNVYSVLPARSASKVSFTKICHVNSIVGPQATKAAIIAAYESVVNVDSFSHKINRYMHDLRTVSWNFTQKNAAQKCDVKTLQEILFYVNSIQREIEQQHPGLEPKSHGISAMRLTNTSAARAVNAPNHRGERNAGVKTPAGTVFISPKDRDVANFMEKQLGVVRPSEVGQQLFPKKTKMASKVSALRSLQKLEQCGLIELTKRGHYKWITK